jgi:AraC-like DNA-binding protein
VPKVMPRIATKNLPLEMVHSELAVRIGTHARVVGQNATAISGLTLFRNPAPSTCKLSSVEPSLTVFAQGKKRINVGGNDFVCGAMSFLVASIDLPVQSQIIEASEAMPQLAMRLLLDMNAVREVVGKEDLLAQKSSRDRRGLAVGQVTAGLLSASTRLINLLDTPEDMPFLFPLIEREIIYRILRTPQGDRLRAIATSGNLSHRTAKAIGWLSNNFDKPLRMEELAEVARMGVSTLHHHFRAMTSMSPLQFQKQLRLRTARERMLKDGLDATNAAFEVGYESVSQFNREYSRMFGQPPMRNIRTLRNSKVVMIDLA